jgi:hypothetical protein
MLKHPAGIHQGISIEVRRMNIFHTWAFDVHEVRVGGLYETLQLVPPCLGLSGGVKEIDGEGLIYVM